MITQEAISENVRDALDKVGIPGIYICYTMPEGLISSSFEPAKVQEEVRVAMWQAGYSKIETKKLGL